MEFMKEPRIMNPAKILATGLLFYLLFMPVFAFTGDLRVECDVVGNSDCQEYGYMQGIAAAGMLFGIMLSVGGAYKIRGWSSKKKGSPGGLWFAYEGQGERSNESPLDETTRIRNE
jgi:hypothetical protein